MDGKRAMYEKTELNGCQKVGVKKVRVEAMIKPVPTVYETSKISSMFRMKGSISP